MTYETKRLHEQKAALVLQMEAIVKATKDGNRDFTADEQRQFDDLHKKQEELAANIQRIENLNALTSGEQERLLKLAEENKTSKGEEGDKKQKENRAFTNFLRAGESNLKPEERTILQNLKTRAQSVGTDSAGGYLVPEGFQAELVKALLAYGGVKDVARILNTDSGNDIPWPNMNDTGNTGALLAENTQISEQAITFGVTTLKAYKYTSKSVLASNELLNDSGIGVDQIIAESLAERIARITNTHFTTGDNSAKPQGVVTASSQGKVTASATAVTFSEILDLIHSVDPEYRKNGKFMFNDSTLKAIKKLSIGSSDARPLWDPGIFRAGVPATIDGFPYVINQDVASMGSGNKFMLFGDFNYYLIRNVNGMVVKRLVERYADYDQVGFFLFSRHDGRQISSDNPFKHMRNTTT